ncbi:hypothetical protein NE237_017988 [Protea cynaroides]|uniref:H15 domain-containing protein n=1 Tax=Protea cynaroides TaxID=273540 RepID=A0A9Q0K915_9MAGN|nr:hypothetical protein NE237_017988 [Protea cynaroides]
MSAAGKGKTSTVKAVQPATVKKTKAPMEKKPRSTTGKASQPSHPTYFQMIKAALLSLHEKSGSSPYAIAKYMEDEHKDVLPGNFRKILGLQLKNCVAKGKLIKIKASFKLSESGKKEEAVKGAKSDSEKKAKAPASKPGVAKIAKKSVAQKKAKAPISKPGTAKMANKNDAKKKAIIAKSKSGAAAPKSTKVSKKSETPKRKPGKIVVLKKAKKSIPAKPKQPKSIKSPVAKKARRATPA